MAAQQFVNPFKKWRNLYVPDWLARRRGVAWGAKLLYGALRSFASQNGYCWPRQKHLAAAIGTDERSLQRYLKSLKDLGLIAVDDRRGLRRSNVHRFLEHPWMHGLELGTEEGCEVRSRMFNDQASMAWLDSLANAVRAKVGQLGRRPSIDELDDEARHRLFDEVDQQIVGLFARAYQEAFGALPHEQPSVPSVWNHAEQLCGVIVGFRDETKLPCEVTALVLSEFLQVYFRAQPRCAVHRDARQCELECFDFWLSDSCRAAAAVLDQRSTHLRAGMSTTP